MNPLLLVDFYKPSHYFMYPEGMTNLYSNFTPRKSRIEGINAVVTFGIQHFVLEYLIKQFNDNFFHKNKEELIKEYSKHIVQSSYTHIEDLWDLGFLPIEMKSLDEGTLCPIGVPMLTIKISDPSKYGKHSWIVNYLETLISCMLWQPITSATIAHEYKKLLTKFANETDKKNLEFVDWQGHDFSMRGMSSVESATLSGMGHLLSFKGTDTIPAIYQLESSYNASSSFIGASVPATEHSVMCMGTKEDEITTFRRLLKTYPTGILSVVSDTWDLWKVCTEYLPQLKDEILKRDGKLVIRPDSGNPVDIICGIQNVGIYNSKFNTFEEMEREHIRLYGSCKYSKVQFKGVIELLWNIFGGTTNEQGYKVLDSHIGAIYGDSITLSRATQICERLRAKGFASTNVVFGIGSYTYQYNTRDTFGFAMKATYGEITKQVGDGVKEVWEETECREIFKAPITDSGEKKSKKGLLCVLGHDTNKGTGIHVIDQCTWEQEQKGLLTTIFKDGKLIKQTSLDEIRERLNKN